MWHINVVWQFFPALFRRCLFKEDQKPSMFWLWTFRYQQSLNCETVAHNRRFKTNLTLFTSNNVWRPLESTNSMKNADWFSLSTAIYRFADTKSKSCQDSNDKFSRRSSLEFAESIRKLWITPFEDWPSSVQILILNKWTFSLYSFFCCTYKPFCPNIISTFGHN